VKKNNQHIYNQLRQEYNVFTYERFDYVLNNNKLHIKYTFNLANRYTFLPELTIYLKNHVKYIPSGIELENLIFHIGMIELVSYWKSTCAPTIIIKPFILDNRQIQFWKKIYFHGLGEFFYLNGIYVDENEFVSIVCNSESKLPILNLNLDENKVLVPVGGGKDSVVTLELLKNDYLVIPFIVNPRNASISCSQQAGFSQQEIFEVSRTIHPTLLELNKQGFLNGHTPFSALLGFVTILAAVLTQSKYIALSNESSANEPTVVNGANHQYSKSFEFEKDFRSYVYLFISTDIEYFSFLRPLSEFQIARIFSRLPEYFRIFKSCNVGSGSDTWCGKCPKCLFTAIILLPFIEKDEIIHIFNKNLLDDLTLLPSFKALTGLSEVKPFECVGTVDEVNRALNLAMNNYQDVLPGLLKYYQSSPLYHQFNEIAGEDAVKLEDVHFLKEPFLAILKRYL